LTDNHYLYHVCPKCATLIETEVMQDEFAHESKHLAVYCWDHEDKIEATFIASMGHESDEKDRLLEMGDKYVSIDRTMWEKYDLGIEINCPQCLRISEVSFDLILEDGDDGTTVTAVNCDNCSFHGPVRIRGLFE
jgi:phage FluMu protein Com